MENRKGPNLSRSMWRTEGDFPNKSRRRACGCNAIVDGGRTLTGCWQSTSDSPYPCWKLSTTSHMLRIEVPFHPWSLGAPFLPFPISEVPLCPLLCKSHHRTIAEEVPVTKSLFSSPSSLYPLSIYAKELISTAINKPLNFSRIRVFLSPGTKHRRWSWIEEGKGRSWKWLAEEGKLGKYKP